jgi:hypothetical protein
VFLSLKCLSAAWHCYIFAGFPVYACWLHACMYVQCEDFLLNQKFYHCILWEQNFLTSHYLALK